MSASTITLGSFMPKSWGEDVCVPAGTPACFNLERGFCRFGDGCRFSHSAEEIPWMLQAILNLNRGVVWFNLGKNREFSTAEKEAIEDVMGFVKDFDPVRMPGNPDKGGEYFCAVVHFESIKNEAFQTLASGNCIKFGTPRAQLFRSEIKPREEIKPKQAADSAALQCREITKVSNEVVDHMNDLLRCLIVDFTA